MLVYDRNIGWEYEQHTNEPLVGARCAILLKILATNPARFDYYDIETRRAHAFIFWNTTPFGFDFFAGNYRGSNYPELQTYKVGIQSDSMVGIAPSKVAKDMLEFNTHLNRALTAFSTAVPAAKAAGKDAELLARIAPILAFFLQRFLTIHPYANGNGHMGRLLVAVLLARYGYRPAYWPVDDRPPYGELLAKHRRGNHTPLVNFILMCITGKGMPTPVVSP
jgi:hypothetical protein